MIIGQPPPPKGAGVSSDKPRMLSAEEQTEDVEGGEENFGEKFLLFTSFIYLQRIGTPQETITRI